jgi:hypothetical protein
MSCQHKMDNRMSCQHKMDIRMSCQRKMHIQFSEPRNTVTYTIVLKSIKSKKGSFQYSTDTF